MTNCPDRLAVSSMPVQHSAFNQYTDVQTVGKFAILPLRTKVRGPAFPTDGYDIIDEVIDLFRVNSFFRNFELQGNADRTLLYGILFVNECLASLRARKPNQHEASKQLFVIATDNFSIPGDPGFPLNAMYSVPATPQDVEFLRSYLSQFRQELVLRLVQKLYSTDSQVPSKFWLAFARKQFMNLSLK